MFVFLSFTVLLPLPTFAQGWGGGSLPGRGAGCSPLGSGGDSLASCCVSKLQPHGCDSWEGKSLHALGKQEQVRHPGEGCSARAGTPACCPLALGDAHGGMRLCYWGLLQQHQGCTWWWCSELGWRFPRLCSPGPWIYPREQRWRLKPGVCQGPAQWGEEQGPADGEHQGKGCPLSLRGDRCRARSSHHVRTKRRGVPV